MTVKKLLGWMVLLVIGSLAVSSLVAGPVNIVAGDEVKMIGRFAGDPVVAGVRNFYGGGLFTYEVYRGGVLQGTIQTFCLEILEPVYLNELMTVQSVETYATGGSYGNVFDANIGQTKDEVSLETGWLYSQFLIGGSFGGVNPDFNNLLWINALQTAIWYFESEVIAFTNPNNGNNELWIAGLQRSVQQHVAVNSGGVDWEPWAWQLIDAAKAAVDAGQGVQAYAVNPVIFGDNEQVINRQSFVYLYSVPEPASLALLGLGLLAAGFLRRATH